MIAPSFMFSKSGVSMTLMSPVTVIQTSAFLGGLDGRHHAVAVHDGLERAQRIDLADDDVGAHSLSAHRDASAAPTVAGHDQRAAGEQAVRRADDAVERRLTGAVAVVEEVLGVGIVDRDDRVLELAVVGHGLETNDTGGRLLGAADDVLERLGLLGVDAADDVGAVIHRDLRLVLDGSVDVCVVGVGVLALDGVDADAVLARRARQQCRPGSRAGCSRTARYRLRRP